MARNWSAAAKRRQATGHGTVASSPQALHLSPGLRRHLIVHSVGYWQLETFDPGALAVDPHLDHVGHSYPITPSDFVKWADEAPLAVAPHPTHPPDPMSNLVIPAVASPAEVVQ